VIPRKASMPSCKSFFTQDERVEDAGLADDTPIPLPPLRSGKKQQQMVFA